MRFWNVFEFSFKWRQPGSHKSSRLEMRVKRKSRVLQKNGKNCQFSQAWISRKLPVHGKPHRTALSQRRSDTPSMASNFSWVGLETSLISTPSSHCGLRWSICKAANEQRRWRAWKGLHSKSGTRSPQLTSSHSTKACQGECRLWLMPKEGTRSIKHISDVCSALPCQ